MQETSLEIFRKIKSSGLISKNRLIVYEHIFHNPHRTQAEVAHALGMSLRNMGRFSELQTQDVIQESGKRLCRITGNKSITWEVTGRTALPFKAGMSKKGHAREMITQIGLVAPEELKEQLRDVYRLLL